MLHPNAFNKTPPKSVRQVVSGIGPPTFNQFLTWIARTDSKNVHWNSIMDSIHPCSMAWNAALRLETMEHDGYLILDRLKPDVKYDRIPTRHSHQKSPVTDHFSRPMPEFDDVPPDVLDYFLKLYEVDLKMFGYHWNRTTNLASCSLLTKQGTCC